MAKGRWFRQQRFSRGIGQGNAAKMLGISSSKLSRIETLNLPLPDAWLRILGIEYLAPTKLAPTKNVTDNSVDEDNSQQADEGAPGDEETSAPQRLTMTPEAAREALRRVADYHGLLSKVERLSAHETLEAVFKDMKRCGLFNFVNIERLIDALSLLTADPPSLPTQSSISRR